MIEGKQMKRVGKTAKTVLFYIEEKYVNIVHEQPILSSSE